jgi:hypothetical protein
MSEIAREITAAEADETAADVEMVRLGKTSLRLLPSFGARERANALGDRLMAAKVAAKQAQDLLEAKRKEAQRRSALCDRREEVLGDQLAELMRLARAKAEYAPQFEEN